MFKIYYMQVYNYDSASVGYMKAENMKSVIVITLREYLTDISSEQLRGGFRPWAL